MKKLLPVVLAAIVAATLAASCKQQRGERCQSREDCEEGLECAPATMTCESSTGTGGQIDAMLPVDAAVDAAVPDAMIDAMTIDAAVQ